MKKIVKVYLQDILESIEKIEEFVKGVNKREFEDNTMLQDAVIRRLMIIGEAVRRIRDSFDEVVEELPWKEILGMRNVLVHEYDEIEVDVLWQVIEKGELRELKEKVEGLLG